MGGNRFSLGLYIWDWLEWRDALRHTHTFLLPISFPPSSSPPPSLSLPTTTSTMHFAFCLRSLPFLHLFTAVPRPPHHHCPSHNPLPLPPPSCCQYPPYPLQLARDTCICIVPIVQPFVAWADMHLVLPHCPLVTPACPTPLPRIVPMKII